MDKRETTTFIAKIETYYPRFNEGMSADRLMMKIESWQEMLEDVPLQVGIVALKKYVSTNVYPPTVADIRKAVMEILNPEVGRLTTADAWGEVVQAVRTYGSYRETEALNSLTGITKTVAQAIGWRDICLSEQPDVIRGQFRNMFEQMNERNKKEAAMPVQLRNLITGNNNTESRRQLTE